MDPQAAHTGNWPAWGMLKGNYKLFYIYIYRYSVCVCIWLRGFKREIRKQIAEIKVVDWETVFGAAILERLAEGSMHVQQ